ncbi:hypothetical protein CUMW_217590 [Citrus unshiu]|uniref:Uncharacterized protein n=1 Tax=Citrus unshiu TaxID=55188 RepID=A0A2H5QCR6_CITUN|nr:hypothetical protein CUMW_217590 [Citrus unshiu]
MLALDKLPYLQVLKNEAELVLRKKTGLCLLWWFPRAQGIAPEINVLARGVDNGGWSNAKT